MRKCSSTVRFHPSCSMSQAQQYLQADPGIQLLLFFFHVRFAANLTNACKGRHTLHSFIPWHICGGDRLWCACNINLISIQISKEPSYFSLALNSIVKHTGLTEEVNYSPWKLGTILLSQKLDLKIVLVLVTHGSHTGRMYCQPFSFEIFLQLCMDSFYMW